MISIVSVKPGHNAWLYLTLSDKSRLRLKADDWISQKLVKGLPLNDKQFTDLKYASLKSQLLEYSLRLLARSPQIAATLIPKLKRKANLLNLGIPSEVAIDEVINKLSSASLLDHAAYVQSFIMRHPRQSQLITRMKLMRLGITPDILNQYLNQGTQSDLPKVTALIIKWTKGKPVDFATKQKLMARLYRRGFSTDDIRSAFDDQGDSQ